MLERIADATIEDRTDRTTRVGFYEGAGNVVAGAPMAELGGRADDWDPVGKSPVADVGEVGDTGLGGCTTGITEQSRVARGDSAISTGVAGACATGLRLE